MATSSITSTARKPTISFTCHTRWQGSCSSIAIVWPPNLVHLPHKAAGVVARWWWRARCRFDGVFVCDTHFRRPPHSGLPHRRPATETRPPRPRKLAFVPQREFAARRSDHTKLPAKLEKLWVHSAGPKDGMIKSTAAIAGGFVYAASLNGEVFCLDLKSGERLWTYKSHSSPIPRRSSPVSKGRSL